MPDQSVPPPDSKRARTLRRLSAHLGGWLLLPLVKWGPSGFSRRVRKITKAELGDHHRKLAPPSLWQKARSRLVSPLMALGGVPIALVVITRACGVPSQWLVSSLDVIDRTLATSLTIPVALLGLVIPFLALSVSQVYAKLGLGAIGHAFRQRPIRHLILGALWVLGLEVVALISLRVLRSDIVGQPVVTEIALLGNLFVLTLGWWTVYLLYRTGRAITGVVRSFEPNAILRLLQADLRNESLLSLRREIERIVSLHLLGDLTKGTIWNAPYFRPSEKPVIQGYRKGLISGISLLALKYIPHICKLLDSPKVLKIIIARPYVFITRTDAQIACVRFADSHAAVPRLLELLVRGMYRIDKGKLETRDTLFAASSNYKESVFAFLRSDNESLLRAALEGYELLIADYFALGIRLKAEDRPNVFTDWRPITLLVNDLRSIVETAFASHDGKHIDLFAHWIRTQMDSCVSEGDEFIFERLLGLFQWMHSLSKKYHHAAGLRLAYSESLQTLDYQLFRFGSTQTITAELVAYRIKLATLIIRHVATLLKWSVDDRDPEAVLSFLAILEPYELLGHFCPDLGVEEHEISMALRNDSLSAEARAHSEDLQKAHQLIDRFKENVQRWYEDCVHGAMSYLVDKVIHEAATACAIQPVFARLTRRAQSIASTVAWLDRYNTGGAMPQNLLWEYWSESRQAQSKDPLQAPLFMFAIRALREQRLSEEPLQLPASRAIYGLMDQLKHAVDDAVHNEQWSVLIEGADNETARRVNEAMTRAQAAYKAEVAKSVIEAPLDGDRMADFRSNVEKGFAESLILPPVFDPDQFVDIEGDVRAFEIDLQLPIKRYPKEAFVKQDRVAYWGWGEQQGRSLGSSVDRYAWIKLTEAVTSGNIVSFSGNADTALERLLDRIHEDERLYKVIILASPRTIRPVLFNCPRFTAAHRLGREKENGFWGEHSGVPIYGIQMGDTESILIVDRRSMSFERVRGACVEIRDLTEEECGQVLDTHPDETREKLREQTFVNCMVHYRMRTNGSYQSVLLRPEGHESTDELD